MHFVVTREGHIERASADGLAWLTTSDNREALAALAPGTPSSALPHEHVPLFAPDSPDAPDRYIIILRPADVTAHLLTPRLREVAEYAIVGATCREIATHLGIREATVRDYMKVIYRRLGIASRVELANLLRPRR